MTHNILKNKKHYDQQYKRVQVKRIVYQAENFQSFLDDAIQTDTSWYGLYQGNFKNVLAGKKVLELGGGNGLNAVIMSRLGANVVVTDISNITSLIVQQVNEKIGSNVEVKTGDFCRMDFEPKSFDFIVGKAFLHHLTHELESRYLRKTALLLKPQGHARFFEPAVNNKMLDDVRWMIPVPGRPSSLNKRAFQVWNENDPHPHRDNSTQHYFRIGENFFDRTEAVPMGSIERLHRLLPAGKFNRRFRRWAHRAEHFLPSWFRYTFARSQLIVYSKPLI
jgi:SAM-dependent methyltransferase